ncbi:YcaO-like family protein [Devriesea agamarum]|uniref:YcaO-like family protein n=1 Tax=Devriesea agamarum TaxID=472569 RepID=UPI00155F2141|nr:YcaO-like family protein [Devriesea agamarum]
MGKGIDRQSEASAIFETIEHAAATGVIGTTRAQPTEVTEGEIITDTLSRYALKNNIARYTKFYKLTNKYDLSTISGYYPTSACDLSSTPITSAEETLSNYCSSTGYAAGSNIRDAILHALNEVIERDAIGTRLINFIIKKENPQYHKTFDDETLNHQSKSISKQIGRQLRFVQLPSLAGTTIAAYASSTPYSKTAIVGCGSSWSAAYAAERAIAEAQQEHWANSQEFGIEHDGGVTSEVALARYPVLLHAKRTRNMFYDATQSTSDLSTKTRDKNTNSRSLVAELNNRGYEAYGRVVWMAKTGGAAVCQVIIAGAERFNMIKFGIPIQATGRLVDKETIKHLIKKGI